MPTVEIEATIIATHGPFQLTRTGIVLTEPEISFEEWQEAMAWCTAVEGSVGFWLGALVNLGEALFGEKYSQAMEATGYAEQTLKNFAYVERNLPPAIRRSPTIVPFSVQAEVAPLPPDEQEKWLQKCEEQHLTREELRAQIKQAKAQSAGVPVDLWLVVSCKSAEDQAELADRLRLEGRSVKAK